MSARGRAGAFERARKANARGDIASLREELDAIDVDELTDAQRVEVAQWEARMGYDGAAIALTVIGAVTLLMVTALVYI